jgi:hypothetical protein
MPSLLQRLSFIEVITEGCERERRRASRQATCEAHARATIDAALSASLLAAAGPHHSGTESFGELKSFQRLIRAAIASRVVSTIAPVFSRCSQ